MVGAPQPVEQVIPAPVAPTVSETAGGQASQTTPAIPPGQAEAWLTSADLQSLLVRQPPIKLGGEPDAKSATITVDPNTVYQPYLGVGSGMPQASAYLVTHLTSQTQRHSLLQQLFDPDTGAGLSVLRLPMGATDFSSVGNYTYDDAAAQDTALAHFSLGRDLNDVLPVALQARALNRDLHVLLTPWSPPAWMKTSQTLTGDNGSTLSAQMMPVLAQYFVRTVQAYQAQGLPIWAVTPQNEPQLATTSYPSMFLTAQDEATLIRDHMAPQFAAQGLNTLVLGFDHNYCDPSGICPNPYAVQLTQQVGATGLGGMAWHCYAGNASAMGQFHSDNPNIPIFQTECSSGPWVSSTGSPADYFAATRSLVFDTAINGAQTTLYWPLALDEKAGPQNGGCTNCRGLASIHSDGSGYTLNPEYYALAHVGRFIRAGAMRIDATETVSGLRSVAFLNRDQTILLYVYNTAATAQSINVVCGATVMRYQIAGHATVSLRWNQSGM
jgi:glucosylceramidase